MLDINLIRSKPEWVKAQIEKRGMTVNFTELLKFEEERREILKQNEEMRSTRNTVTSEIAVMKKNGQEAGAKVAEMKKLGDAIASGDKLLVELEGQIFDIISAFPNIPSDEVVSGGKEANKAVKTFGSPRKFDFKPKEHVDLCTSLGLIDYERGSRMSGAGTWVYTGKGAMLEWALLNYFVEFHISNGYEFIMPPHILNYESGYAAGQFPKFEDDVFFLNVSENIKQNKFLLPTSETALINMHRGEIIPSEKLPIKYAAYSPCYRKEAGGYGASERGMIRGHQFNKIEMFMYSTAEQSPALFEELVANAEKLVEGLGLHFQTVALAAGDVSAGMAKTYDIEVHIPSMNGYKECSSVSNAHDYQARRAGIRTKIQTERDGKKVNESSFVHTLNASGLATSRLIPAIVEQFQNEDGSVTVPPVLHKYMFGITKISK